MSQPTPLGYPHAGAGTVEILLEKEDGADFAVLFHQILIIFYYAMPVCQCSFIIIQKRHV